MSGTIIIAVVVGVAAFICGIRYERARVAYATWRDTVHAIPGLRSMAFLQVRRVWLPAVILAAVAAGLLLAI